MNEAQSQQLINDVAAIKTSLQVHLAEHRVVANLHRAAYGCLTVALGSVLTLLVSHWK